MIEHNFKKLLIWQESIALVVDTYALTKTFPAKEKFGLISQLNRCAVSIPSNITEGTSKSTDKHFKTYLETALGSAFEWESQVIISHKLNYFNDSQFEELEKKVNRIQNMIFKFKAKL
ncbi:MAG: four helix bundle protein [Putridiphycobacter sp.]|nr:four helix bundle protein [Putridiphycobacter sp.]